jgi:hypothetical protein
MPTPSTPFTTLISVEQLQALRASGAPLKVFDCTSELMNPEAADRLYAQFTSPVPCRRTWTATSARHESPRTAAARRLARLLLPAGSLAKMRAAYDFGADAVYAGQPRYSLRARNNEFRLEQIARASEAHARGKKFFVTSNLLPHNDKVRTYLRDIEPVIAMGPDALIMADPGLIMMVREKWPECPSTSRCRPTR